MLAIPPAVKKIKSTLGRYCHLAGRHLAWRVPGRRYAATFGGDWLPALATRHHTPLIRELRNVDLWMQYNKVTNLRLAVARLSGVVVYPGETFSFWRLIGRPTRRKGYVEAMILMDGRVITGVGGGLCQLSNLIYWLTLHTPLAVTERYRHNYDVFPDVNRTVPFGSGATCYYNYIDLQLFNGTDRPYQLRVYLTERDLVGEWRTDPAQDYTYEVYQKEHWITHEPYGYVRHNTIYRKIYGPEKKLVADEFVTENHALMMYQPFLPHGSSE